MKTKTLTVKGSIVKLLKGRKRGLTPTEIAVKLGYEGKNPASSVMRSLGQLLDAGLVEKTIDGRKVTYLLVA